MWTPTLDLPRPWAQRPAHPIALAEAPNLSATPLPVIGLWSPLSVPRNISAAQAEAAACALACFRRGRGFWLGDATGVGKGRTLATLAYEHTRPTGHVALWFTPNSALHSDAARDVRAVAGPDASELLRGTETSVLQFMTYRALSSHYEEVVSPLRVRCPGGNDLLLMFDEAHTGRNASSGIGSAMARMQEEFPHAHVVYSTATAASDLRRLTYMHRLCLWGPGSDLGIPTAEDFVTLMEQRGPAAVELVAMHLKRRGMYVARSLDQGATVQFRVVTHCLSPDERLLYDECTEYYANPMVAQSRASDMTRLRFFANLITAFKTQAAVDRAKEHLHRGRQVLITLQGTGASASAQRRNLGVHRPDLARAGALAIAMVRSTMRDGVSDPHLAAMAERLLDRLPGDPIDVLHQHLHAWGIVELSGKGSPSVALTQANVSKFQRGDARVAILSAAAGQGLSLHADATGSAQRAHILLELPWSAEAFIQQCGRSSRTGQTSAPVYELVVSDVPAEQRFTAGIMRRMQGVGAVTRGDRTSDLVGTGALAAHCGAGASASTTPALLLLYCKAIYGEASRRGLPPPYVCSATERQHINTRDLHAARQADPMLNAHMRNVTRTQHGLGEVLQVVHANGGLGRCRDDTVRMLASVVPIAESTLTGRVQVANACGGVGSCSVPSSWTPSRHAEHPVGVRRAIRALMLVAIRGRTCDANSIVQMLGALPHDTLLVVVGHLASGRAEAFGDNEQARCAYVTLTDRVAGGPSGVANHTSTREQYLNLSLRMPLHVQREMHRSLEQVGLLMGPVVAPGEHTVRNLEDYILGSSSASMELIATVGTRSDAGLITIEASARARVPVDRVPEWTNEGVVLGHGVGISGEPFVLVRNTRARKNYVEYWKAGRALSTRSFPRVHDALDYVGVHGGYYSREDPDDDWCRRWSTGIKAYECDVTTRASKVRTRLTVATDRALELWEQSLQQVVRATPPVVSTAFTCLVMRSEQT